MSTELLKMRNWTLWRGRPLLKMKKRLHTEYELEMWEPWPLQELWLTMHKRK
jgi:hypothetical protein